MKREYKTKEMVLRMKKVLFYNAHSMMYPTNVFNRAAIVNENFIGLNNLLDKLIFLFTNVEMTKPCAKTAFKIYILDKIHYISRYCKNCLKYVYMSIVRFY